MASGVPTGTCERSGQLTSRPGLSSAVCAESSVATAPGDTALIRMAGEYCVVSERTRPATEAFDAEYASSAFTARSDAKEVVVSHPPPHVWMRATILTPSEKR